MRVGILLLAHESNTFIARPTTIDAFRADTLLLGDAIRERFTDAHHEVGGFFAGLDAESLVETVPIFAARALPSGAIDARAFDELLDRLFHGLDAAGPLDGLLLAPHGAMVAESHPDADGHWLAGVRQRVGTKIPIIATIDPHANLSQLMVDSCDALIAYRSNPHLDQRDRGHEAARLIVRTLKGEIRPEMHAEFPAIAINIERQLTTEPHMLPLYELADRQLRTAGVLTNSVVLGFPYADVPEMGSAVISVTDNDAALASSAARELSSWLRDHRDDFVGEMIEIDEALDRCEQLAGPVCLLDMGDNVGGGSSADGTWLAHAIHQRRLARAFVCICDPEAVSVVAAAGDGEVELTMGGKTDDQHGVPLTATCRLLFMWDGRFSETQVRHGGQMDFDQGPTAVVGTDRGMTIMLTSKRMVPFSLQQLTSSGLDPTRFQIIVAKGVNAPVAAYCDVCPHLIRVNTPGSTCADLTKLEFRHRRRPLFPFEQ